jgi:hypothetical protein
MLVYVGNEAMRKNEKPGAGRDSTGFDRMANEARRNQDDSRGCRGRSEEDCIRR